MKQGKSSRLTGKEKVGGSLQATALMNAGDRPYICERPLILERPPETEF